MKYQKPIIIALILTVFKLTSITAQIDPQIGQNYMFWILGQGFFSGYYQSSATLSATGDNCYVFTEDALVRDISVYPYDSDVVVATTNSGIFISTNAGSTWVSSNGNGSNILPEEEVAGLVNIDLDDPAIQHRRQVHSIAFEDSLVWWVGTNGAKGAYRSVNKGSTWKKKSTGLPTFDGENPDVYKIYFEPGEKNPYVATNAGLYYKESRFTNLGAGFPDPSTTDWPSIPVYDVLIFDTLIVAGTENGLYRGSVSEKFGDKLPIEGGTIVIDTTFFTYVLEETLVPDTTDSFSIDWTSGDSIWVINYHSEFDTISWYLTLGLNDISSIGNNVPENQLVYIQDDSTGTLWRGKVVADPVLEKLTVSLLNEKVYFFKDGLFDPTEDDSVTYNNYNVSKLVVYSTGNEPVTNITIDSTGTVYYTTSTGVYSIDIGGGTPTTLGLSDITVNELALSADESILFAATTKGLQKTPLDGEINWSEVTPKINTLNTGDLISYVVTSIAVVNENTIYVGCGNPPFEDPRTIIYRTGGVLVSYDGGDTWTAKNLGLTHRSSNLEDVASVVTAFDSTTTVDSTKGIYEILTTWYGSPPNIDNNDKVLILLADMDDNSYNTTDDLVIQGYFNPADQSMTDVQPNSNYLDMIYIDTDPQDPGESQEGISRALSRLICYNYDPEEGEWILAGLEQYGPYLTGYRSMPENNLFKVDNNNSLAFGDFGRKKEFNQLFTFIEFLYEHYLDEDPFKPESDPLKMISALVQENEPELLGLENVLRAATENVKGINDVFTEWALALYFDDPDSTWNNGLYGFSNIDIEISPSTYPWGITSGAAPYSETIKNWAPKFMQSEKWIYKAGQWVDKSPAFNGENLVFNGSDASDMTFIVVKQRSKAAKDTSVFIDFVELDAIQNKVVYTNWSDFGSDSLVVTDSAYIKKYQYYALIAICRDAGDDAGGSFVIDNSINSPDLFDLQINQNTELTNYLDIYAFSDVPIYDDGAVSYNTDLEGPKVQVDDGDTIRAEFKLPIFYNTGEGYIYRETFDLESLLPTTASQFLFIGFAESIGGNKAESDTTLVIAVKVDASAGKYIVSKLGGFSLSIPPFAIEKDEYITIIEKTKSDIVSETINPISNILTMGPSNLVIEKEFVIKFDLSGIDLNSVDIRKLDIVSFNDGKVSSLSAVVDEKNKSISTKISSTGSIQLVVNPAKRQTDNLPVEYTLYQNYPNPFNPVTNLIYDLPQDGWVSLKIYDVLGREVVDLSQGYMKAGKYTVQWAGIDNRGKKAATGVYFYRLETEHFSQTRKMLLVK